MSKQSENKEKQGFRKDAPCCSNCVNFTFEKKPLEWDPKYFKDTNLRCSIGGFAVGKSNWCKLHEFNKKGAKNG